MATISAMDDIEMRQDSQPAANDDGGSEENDCNFVAAIPDAFIEKIHNNEKDSGIVGLWNLSVRASFFMPN